MGISVRLILDLLEDRRLSMENYATQLENAARALGDCQVTVETFRPRYIAPGLLPRAWRDRWARYRGFPMQLEANPHGIDHVIDHGYAHVLRVLRPEKTVVTAHDIIPLLATRGALPGTRRRTPWLSEFSARFLGRAGAIIAVSQNTKKDLIDYLRIPEQRIHVVPNGISDDFRVLQIDRLSVRRLLSLPEHRALVLITGTQFYKNHVTSVRVLKRLRETKDLDVQLVCMGALSADARRLVEQCGLSQFITEIKPADQESLVRLYNAVDCLLFPSLYEGFGWPVLEAMACGVPVVCSNGGALVEVAGDAALIASPLDVATFTDHITSVLLLDAESRQRITSRGIKRAGKFTWQSHASGVTAIYRQLA